VSQRAVEVLVAAGAMERW